jgi:hypothetical protein
MRGTEMEDQRCSNALKRDLPIFAALSLFTLPLFVYCIALDEPTIFKYTLNFTLVGVGVLAGWFMAMDTVKEEEKKSSEYN